MSSLASSSSSSVPSGWELIRKIASIPPAGTLAPFGDVAPSTQLVGEPSPSQLAAMPHVTAALFSTRQKSRRGNSGKHAKLAKDGQNISKMFNPIAGRPLPALVKLSQEITVTMNLQSTLFSTSASVPTFAAQAFTLAQFANYANYVSLFDEYKIHQIEVWLEPTYNSTGFIDGGFASCVDLDDANVPS
jgi:hypothetical protein